MAWLGMANPRWNGSLTPSDYRIASTTLGVSRRGCGSRRRCRRCRVDRCLRRSRRARRRCLQPIAQLGAARSFGVPCALRRAAPQPSTVQVPCAADPREWFELNSTKWSGNSDFRTAPSWYTLRRLWWYPPAGALLALGRFAGRVRSRPPALAMRNRANSSDRRVA
jgi:hypothetical protein